VISPLTGEMPKALTREEIKEIVEQFADASLFLIKERDALAETRVFEVPNIGKVDFFLKVWT
jgi:hypothetical protein